MSHEAARSLEKSGYQLDHEQSSTAEPAVEVGGIPGYSACISSALRELLAELHDLIIHLSASTNVELRHWQQLKPVDFLEVFPDSSGQLTIRVAESGGTIREPVGAQTISYERTWAFGTKGRSGESCMAIGEQTPTKSDSPRNT